MKFNEKEGWIEQPTSLHFRSLGKGKVHSLLAVENVLNLETDFLKNSADFSDPSKEVSSRGIVTKKGTSLAIDTIIVKPELPIIPYSDNRDKLEQERSRFWSSAIMQLRQGNNYYGNIGMGFTTFQMFAMRFDKGFPAIVHSLQNFDVVVKHSTSFECHYSVEIYGAIRCSTLKETV